MRSASRWPLPPAPGRVPATAVIDAPPAGHYRWVRRSPAQGKAPTTGHTPAGGDRSVPSFSDGDGSEEALLTGQPRHMVRRSATRYHRAEHAAAAKNLPDLGARANASSSTAAWTPWSNRSWTRSRFRTQPGMHSLLYFQSPRRMRRSTPAGHRKCHRCRDQASRIPTAWRSPLGPRQATILHCDEPLQHFQDRTSQATPMSRPRPSTGTSSDRSRLPACQ